LRLFRQLLDTPRGELCPECAAGRQKQSGQEDQGKMNSRVRAMKCCPNERGRSSRCNIRTRVNFDSLTAIFKRRDKLAPAFHEFPDNLVS
jgi:hypothetical protein